MQQLKSVIRPDVLHRGEDGGKDPSAADSLDFNSNYLLVPEEHFSLIVL